MGIEQEIAMKIAFESVSRCNVGSMYAAFVKPGPLVRVPGPTLAENRKLSLLTIIRQFGF
jgi:hypothetical protein